MSYNQQQPIGNNTDLYFTFQDFYNVQKEFPSSPGSYFSNHEGQVICIPSVLQPAIQWCSTKAQGELHLDPFAVGWTKPPVLVPVVHVPSPPDYPPPTVTPEPSMVGFLLVIALAVFVFTRRWRKE